MSEETECEKKTSCWAEFREGGVEEKALKRFFTMRKKKNMLHCRRCSLLQMLNLFFIIIIIILHGKIAVDDISAFYLQHFTFFMSFKDVLARFACHTAKKIKIKGKKKI